MTETLYLQSISKVVTVVDVVAIARRAVVDAKKGSAQARDWVTRHLLGNINLKAKTVTEKIEENPEAFWRAVCQAMANAPQPTPP